jgi:hypothetical protein
VAAQASGRHRGLPLQNKTVIIGHDLLRPDKSFTHLPVNWYTFYLHAGF